VRPGTFSGNWENSILSNRFVVGLAILVATFTQSILLGLVGLAIMLLSCLTFARSASRVKAPGRYDVIHGPVPLIRGRGLGDLRRFSGPPAAQCSRVGNPVHSSP
jgi:hypothetical protein